MGKEVIFKAEGIYKSFGATKALQNFSMEIKSGEIIGLIGENGSGKSTFSSIMAGIRGKDSGTMYIGGKEYDPINQNEAGDNGIALVMQEIGTIASISVASNIFVNKEKQYARLGLINYKAMNDGARNILNQIGGEHIIPEAVCGSLNLEDRKLVEIAKAMITEPRILIIDETSNALASRGRDILYKNMKTVRERGGAVLFITHDMDELVEVCDRVTIMRDGYYIDTLSGDGMIPKKMKELMVGREIADNYYRGDTSPNYKDDIVLKIDGIVNANLNNVSFELHEGEILGIGGLAECGMHELGKVLFGLDKADYGTVMLGNGANITNPIKAVKNKIGYLSKNRDTEAILLNYKISDNIVLPSLRSLRKGLFIFTKDEKALSKKWADELSLKRRSNEQRVFELSGGNKQKVVVAKWLANKSKIFIMDCPTRGIDVGVKEAIYKIMEHLKEKGCSIIMISEEMPELIGMSDRILVMKDGEIAKEVLRSADVTERQIINYMI